MRRVKILPALLVGVHICSYYGNQCDGASRIVLPHDIATPLPGIYQKDCSSNHKDMCSFIAVLFIVTRTEKQPIYLSTEDG